MAATKDPPMIRRVTDKDALGKIEACAKRVKQLEAEVESCKETLKSLKQDLDDNTAQLIQLGAGDDLPLIQGDDDEQDED